MDDILIIQKHYHDFIIHLFPRNDIKIKDLSQKEIQKIKDGNYLFYYLERADCNRLYVKIAGYNPILSLITVGKK
jgi:hypothetical protein